MTETVVKVPIFRREAQVVDGSANADNNTIDVIWTAGATVRRRKWSWDSDTAQEYDEQLIVEPKSVRLDSLDAGGPFLNSHNDWNLSSVLGSVVPGSVRLASGKGYATIKLSRAEADAGIIGKIKDKIIRNISVGYRIHRTEIVQRKDAVPLHRVIDWEPLEISAVGMQADPGAHTRAGEKPDLFECIVTHAGDVPDNSRERIHQMDKEIETETVVAPPVPPVADKPADKPAETRAAPIDVEGAVSRAIMADRTRMTEINSLAKRFAMPAEFAETHISKGSRIDEVRVAIMDAVAERSDKQGSFLPAEVKADARDKFRDGLTEALLLRAGHKDGKRNEFSGLSLREAARESLRAANGDHRISDPMVLVSEAMGLNTRAVGYHSTSDFPQVLANVAKKSMLKGFEEAEETFEKWTARGVLTDFKPTKRVDLNLFPSLLHVPEGAEYKHGTVGERGETVTLATYGRLFAITRQAIINDDMSVFTRLPASMGRAARRTVANLAWAVLTANAAMADGIALFHADHGNLSGAAAAPSVATIDTAKVAMAKQRDPDLIATALNIRPKFLLVPVEYEGTALVTMQSEFNPANTQRVPNHVRGLAEVISDARLSIHSATRWYMAADPNAVDTIEVSYLNGDAEPKVEQQPGWDVDGMSFKVRIDAAVKALDYRGLYANGT